jgi:hypothetical protein
MRWSFFGRSRGGPGPTLPESTVTLRRFTPGEPTLSKDLRVEDGAWVAEDEGSRVIPLFELAGPAVAVDSCLLTYQASVKSVNLRGRAYLEMWCRLPGRGEFFSKGLAQTIRGNVDWSSFQIQFRLKKGQRPDLIKLNLAIEGRGTVWIKDIVLLMTPK